MDFGVWSILEQKPCPASCSSVDALKKNLTKVWEEIESETLRVTCKQVVPRLHRLIRVKRGYYRINFFSHKEHEFVFYIL